MRREADTEEMGESSTCSEWPTAASDTTCRSDAKRRERREAGRGRKMAARAPGGRSERQIGREGVQLGVHVR